MESTRLVKLSRVMATATPPQPLTAEELRTVRQMVAAQQRRSARRAADNRESGLVRELQGGDADAVRAVTMKRLQEKLDAWIVETQPLVDEAEIAAGGTPIPMIEGSRVAEGEGETVGEARWHAMRNLEAQVGVIDPAKVDIQVISEGVRGMLGVGKEPARVMAKVVAA